MGIVNIGDQFSRKITPKQVNLLIAIWINKEMKQHRTLLEFVEFECGIQVSALEEIPMRRVEEIIQKLEEE